MIPQLEIHRGDITKIKVDAVVNAASETLLGGAGVDGKIHAVAGPELLEECKALNGCDTGKAKITKGYNLKAKHVIHTVGPIYWWGKRDDYDPEDLLWRCYINSLALADENNLESIAFPAISTGVHGFPKKKAAFIAHRALINYFITRNTPETSRITETTIKRVILVAFSDEDKVIYDEVFSDPFHRRKFTWNSDNIIIG